MILRIVFASILIATAAIAQQSTTETVKEAVTDTAISARIETLFAVNEQLSPFDINTTTIEGVVTLTGSVADEVQKDLAADLAQTVEGVTKIENKLLIVDQVPEPRPRKSWIQRIDDKSLAAAIRSNLLYNKEFKGLKIGVDCDAGHVTLFGVVGNFYAKENIEKIVSETRGVQKVTNNLTVHAAQKTDPVTAVTRSVSNEVLATRVETSIALNRYVSTRNLKVKVDNGLCILTGTVDSDQQRGLAEEIASNISGIERVQNDLKIYAPPALPEPPPPPANGDAPPPPADAPSAPLPPAPKTTSETLPPPAP